MIVTTLTHLRGWEAHDLAQAAGLPLASIRALLTDQDWPRGLALVDLQARMIRLGAALEIPPARLLGAATLGAQLRALVRTARRVTFPSTAQRIAR